MAISPIWPQDTARDANGELTFHGITASALVNEYGSPLYVYDLDEVRSRAKHCGEGVPEQGDRAHRDRGGRVRRHMHAR